MEFIATPVGFYFRKKSLKGCFHDGNNNPTDQTTKSDKPFLTTQELRKVRVEFVTIRSKRDRFSWVL